MRLTMFYALVAIGYLALSIVNERAAQVAVPFVTVLLLAPAVYGEWLRLRGPGQDA